jgi:hypothetical protein
MQSDASRLIAEFSGRISSSPAGLVRLTLNDGTSALPDATQAEGLAVLMLTDPTRAELFSLHYEQPGTLRPSITPAVFTLRVWAPSGTTVWIGRPAASANRSPIKTCVTEVMT